MQIKMRDYQEEAKQAIPDYFAVKNGNPLILAPTGSGKSVIIAGFLHWVYQQWPDQRILILTHVRELVAQNYERLKQVWKEAPAGIYSASLGRRDTNSKIIYASIQSVYKKAFQLGYFDLILVDECHLLPESGEGMYHHFIGELRRINPRIKVVGFTATPFRMKSGHLIGEGSLFTDVAYDKCDIRFLVENGYLCPVVPKRTETELDTEGARTRAGEFVQGDLQRLCDVDEITQAAVLEMIQHGADRRSWLVFCTGVDHAFHVRDALRAAGVSAETITGKTPKQERALIVHKFKSGIIRALTNCDTLTTGFDAPATDMLAILRPTRSPGLWVQIVGRGMRIAPGKTDCLVLDFARNTERHGPIDQITMGQKKKRNSDENLAPVKECPECHRFLAVGVRTCECGYEFPLPEARPVHDSNASDEDLLSFFAGKAQRDVSTMRFYRHQKPGKPDSLRVSYFSGLNRIADEWVCLEHGGPPKLKAINWWNHWIGGPVPKDVTEALDLLGSSKTLERVVPIYINRSGRYNEVIGWGYQDQEKSA